MIKKLIFATLLISGLMTAIGQTSDLTVLIHGAHSTRGKIRIGLFDNADNFKAKVNPADSAVVTITDKGKATYTFHNLPEGSYAVAVYHDENNDGTLTKRHLGIPVEGIGFSNFPEFKRKPPVFEEVAFDLKDKDMTIEIPLFYHNNKQENSNQKPVN